MILIGGMLNEAEKLCGGSISTDSYFVYFGPISFHCESFTLDHWTVCVNVLIFCIREPLPHYLVDFLVSGYLWYF
jgi:hypothetical protein